MTSYIALIRKDLDSDYGVEFPDFPVASLPEQHWMMPEAWQKKHRPFIEGMIEGGERLPVPLLLETVMKEVDNREAVAILVDAPQSDLMIRVNVTLLRSVLEAIGSHRNRSAFLAQAAMERMNGRGV